MFKNNSTFYPTPYNIARRMFEKLETLKVNYILEPSAGKGDLIEHYKKYFEILNSRWMGYNKKAEDYITFDAIEIDDNLVSLLRGKSINVIWDDFLSFEPQRFYQLILANFPFDRGCDHILKAIEIQERIGGQILCLINAETIKNPYSNNRKHLVKLLEQYKADIEFIENAFTDAERQTDVEIALIHINIPMKNNDTIFEREFKRDNPEIDFKNIQALTVNKNKLEQLIFECELIKKSCTELFKEKMKIDILLDGMNLKSKLKICDDSCHPKILTINDFINNVNLEYWNKFINETDFKNRLPSKLRNNFSYNMEKQKDITFNLENVRYFYEELIKSIPQSYEETIAKLFDDLTRKYSYTDGLWNQNIHLFSGWKSNSCYKISNKCIIPIGTGFYFYNLPETLIDLNIVFENLSGEKDSLTKDDRIYKAIKNYEKKIETKFFVLDSFKKGTLHITFKDKELLSKFNVLGAKGKNALPPDFGSKHYNDMTHEEKQLVKDFGFSIQEYNSLMIGRNNYLRLTS